VFCRRTVVPSRVTNSTKVRALSFERDIRWDDIIIHSSSFLETSCNRDKLKTAEQQDDVTAANSAHDPQTDGARASGDEDMNEVPLRPLTSLKWPYVPEESAYPDPLKRDDPKPLQLAQYEAIGSYFQPLIMFIAP
jgi:hypothetical protein